MRILLIADDPLARAGLAALLADAAHLAERALAEQEIEIAGQLASQDADLDTAPSRFRPDVTLWDLGWEPSENLDRLADFTEIGPPVVALLAALDQASLVWQTGIRGLLARDAGGAQIVAALSAAIHGLVVIEPELTSILPLDRAAQARDEVLEALTPREFDVLQLLAEGAPNKEIARQLSISDHTVKYHVNAILGKLGAQSRTEAVVRATRSGLILL